MIVTISDCVYPWCQACHTKKPTTRQIADLRIELEQVAPRIWRRVEVSVAMNLRALHEIIQAVMPWENTHLYRFTIADRFFGEPVPVDALWGHNIFQAKLMRLGTLINRGITEFIYTTISRATGATGSP